jgi:hypothetical protein
LCHRHRHLQLQAIQLCIELRQKKESKQKKQCYTTPFDLGWCSSQTDHWMAKQGDQPSSMTMESFRLYR